MSKKNKSNHIEIYVDAGGSHNLISNEVSFKIGIYNKYKNRLESYCLNQLGIDNNKAEKLAIIYGILYLKSFCFTYKKTIYSDSKCNVDNSKIQAYCQKHKIELIWIKGTTNKIADRLTKIGKYKEISLDKKKFMMKQYNKLI